MKTLPVRLTRRSFSILLTSIMAIVFIFSAYPSQAAGYPSLTYFRASRYGTAIDITYCIGADSFNYVWGESYPGNWTSFSPSYGAISGCQTKRLFYNVAGNENLFVEFGTNSNSGGFANYGFVLYPRGSNSMSCGITYAGTFLRTDPRLVSTSACAFWDQ